MANMVQINNPKLFKEGIDPFLFEQDSNKALNVPVLFLFCFWESFMNENSPELDIPRQDSSLAFVGTEKFN